MKYRTHCPKHRAAKAAPTIKGGLRAAGLALGMLLLAGTAVQPAAAAAGDTTDWVLPLASKSYKYSSEFGARCIPVIGGSTAHLGLDLAAPANTPITAAAGGIVVKTKNGTNSFSGIIVVEHKVKGRKITSAYYHMWNATTHVKVGDKVRAGQRIGLVGTSGPSTANHLHFEVWEGGWYSGKAINPTAFMQGKGVNLKANASVVWNFKTPASCTYYSAVKAGLRAQPAASSALLKTLPAGTIMSSKPGIIVKNYVPVTVGGVSGWVPAGGVSTQRVRAASVAPVSSAVVRAVAAAPAAALSAKAISPTNYTVTYPVNLRSGPGTSTRSVRIVPKGAVLKVNATSGKWFRVPGGWIHSDYLTKTAAPKAVKKTTTANLHIRTGASTSYRSLKVLPKGTIGTVVAKSGSWTKLTAGGVTGWVFSGYLK